MKLLQTYWALGLIIVFSASVGAQEETPQKSPEETLAEILEEAKADATRVRGLPFLKPIPVGRITASELKDAMLRDMGLILGEGDHLKNMERLLQTLRVLPEKTGFVDLTERFFSASVGANYNPTTGRISFLRMYKSRAAQKSVMVHELTHALQDQHHHLMEKVLRGPLTFDRVLAFGALVEGDAENVQRTFQTAGMISVTPIPAIRALGEQAIRNYLSRMKDFPMGVARAFIFQYMDGLLFVETVKRAREGFKGIDAAFRDPPATTEQILHPEKYLERDRPTRILPGVVPPGHRELISNVLGELGVSIVLGSNLPRGSFPGAAEGWDGDRVVLFEDDKGGTVLAWYTTWDTRKDAAEFAEKAGAMLAARHPGSTTAVDENLGVAYLVASGRAHTVVSRGKDVLLVEGLSGENPGEILAILLKVAKETTTVSRGAFGEEN